MTKDIVKGLFTASGVVLISGCFVDPGAGPADSRREDGALAEARQAACAGGPVAPLNGPIQAGLVALYRFDECAGAVASESTGLGTNGALNNFPTDDSQWVPGQIGGSLDFRGPGAQDYVIAPDYVKPTASMSVSAWVWADSRPTWATIVKNWGSSQVGQFHFGLEGNAGPGAGNLDNYFDTGASFASEGGLFPLGSWEHVAFVADAAAQTMTIYRNGAVTGGPSFYDGTLAAPPIAALGIGVKTDNAGTTADPFNPGYWDGKIDDLALWTRALSAAEITQIYQAGLSGVSVGEVGDTDGDGIPDGNDNCPTRFNPNQLDSDANGTGDACEPVCVTLQSVKDALIRSDQPAKNYATSLTTGEDPPSTRHALIAWDLSAIPAQSTVVSATATLTVLLFGGAPVNAHRIGTAWSEATVTWGNFSEAVPVTPIAATFPGATVTFPATASVSADLSALAQGWVSGALPNQGIQLEQDAATGQATVFAGHEDARSAARPKLQVCYF
ncbi:MAG: DNRLRE domain-containing protein [Minicystis sp.]